MTDAAVGYLRIPEVPEALLSAHERAHGQAADSLLVLAPAVRSVASAWLRERSIEALAGIRASSFGTGGALLLPVPRGYLGPDSAARLRGTRRALEHLEARFDAFASGEMGSLLGWETPFVVHALCYGETAESSNRIGMLRSSATGWRDRVHAYQPPDASAIPELLREHLATLAVSAAPPAAVAPWFAFAWMTLHPFSDGNGRTARLLHQLLAAPGLPLHADVGIAEMWVVHRTEYLQRLKDGQGKLTGFQPELIDASPFVEASVRWSTQGAELTTARLELAGYLDRRLDAPEELRATVIAALLHRGVQPGALLPWPYTRQVELLEMAARAGMLTRTPVPVARLATAVDRFPFYTPAPPAWRLLHEVVAERQAGDGQR